MRDIRSDLQDRVSFIEEQIGAAQSNFERQIEHLKSERDAKIAGLKIELAALATLMDCEHRRVGAPHGPGPMTLEAQPMPLADFFLRRLGEHGPSSKEDLRAWAVQEGYFPDADAAGRGVHATLLNIVKAGRIRQLPDGTFAPPTLMEALRQRRAG